MVLIDKLAGYSGDVAAGNTIPEANVIDDLLPAHEFSLALGLFLSEGIGTLNAIQSAFDLTAAERTTLDQVETFFNTLNNRQKDRFLNRFEGLTILLQFTKESDNTIILTKTQYKSFLGFT